MRFLKRSHKKSWLHWHNAILPVVLKKVWTFQDFYTLNIQPYKSKYISYNPNFVPDTTLTKIARKYCYAFNKCEFMDINFWENASNSNK